MWSFIGAILGGFLAFLGGIFSEPLKEWFFKPDLNFEFGQGADFITPAFTKTKDDNPTSLPVFYIRVKVRNNSKYNAKDCRVYLTNIEKKDESGKFKKTYYCDSLRLPWANRMREGLHFSAINIHYKIAQFFDVIVTMKTYDSFVPQLVQTPMRYKLLFKEKGVFRFTILLSAQSIEPKLFKLIFEWGEVWDEFVVYEEGKSKPQNKKHISLFDN